MNDELMLCAAYLALGAKSVLCTADGESYRRATDGQGELGFMADLVAHAPMIEAAWLAMPQSARDEFDRVWAYEIVEPFGIAYARAMLAGQEFNAAATLDSLLG
jgi:hypothetical protein